MLFGKTGVHAEDLGREQRCFVAARACADFEDHVLFVVAVLGQQQNLELFFERDGTRFQGGDLLFGHGAQVGVGLSEHGARVAQPLLHLLQLAILLDGLFNLAQRLRGLGVALVVVDDFRQRELRLQFRVALLHLFQTIQHDNLPLRGADFWTSFSTDLEGLK